MKESDNSVSRRSFLGASGLALVSAAAVSGRAAAAIPEAPTQSSPLMQPPLVPTTGPDYQPVVTLNGWTMPWRMSGDRVGYGSRRDFARY